MWEPWRNHVACQSARQHVHDFGDTITRVNFDIQLSFME